MVKKEVFNKKIVINSLLVNYYFFPAKSKSAKTLIFLHGWGVNSRYWFKIIENLKQFNIYLIDLPGFGESQVPPTSYNVDDYKNIVKEFINKISLKKIVIIGHSFGGRITIKLASENPEYLKKIILVDTAGVVNSSSAKKIVSIFAKLISPIFKPSFMQSVRKKLYSVLGSEYLENEKLSKIFSNVVSEDLVKILKNISVPTLIIWGNKDKITPLIFAYLIKQKIKNSKLLILKNAGHFSFLDQPEKFVKNLTEFL